MFFIYSCAPNPLKCGGTGGCMGSVEPLAFTYASLFGVVTEDEYPYTRQGVSSFRVLLV
jgi:hypothetical protein